MLVGAAVAAVVAVGAAGVFAVSQFNGTAQGGAATPNELGTQLLTAIENEDVLGMIDVLSPGERDVFRDPMIDLVSELTRLEVLSPEADLANIEGVDIELEFESVTVRSTNVADIVNVDMRSEATSTVDGQAFPIGDLITDNLDPADVTEIRGTVETVHRGARLQPHRRRGRRSLVLQPLPHPRPSSCGASSTRRPTSRSRGSPPMAASRPRPPSTPCSIASKRSTWRA